MSDLYKFLQNASTEEELKHNFAKYFKLKLDAKNYIDLYTPQILFEFKYNANLGNLQTRASCIAQTLYYIRRLKYGNEFRTPSNSICVVTKNAAILVPTKNFTKYYGSRKYDWDLMPSSPCKKLIADLTDADVLREAHVYDFNNNEDESEFTAQIRNRIANQLSIFGEKKEINEYNFYAIFEYWQKLFGNYVDNSHKPSEYFITDIEEGKTDILADRTVIFRMSGGTTIEKFLPIAEYRHFWNVYEKVSNPRAVISIRQKMDRMSEISMRRFTGEFFTPIEFASKAVEYLERTVGANWYKSGKFRLWDMAAGTGNLEFALPAEALQYCYISTLLRDDADYCRNIFPTATVFQYDYLNDDVEFIASPMLDDLGAKRKMPSNLAKDLSDPSIKWIIFINPPYATAANPRKDKLNLNKDRVSMTAIRNLMAKDNLKASSQELSVQFLYRISREFKERQAWLGMFSKLTYLKSGQDEKFRAKILAYKFDSGFIFNSKNFDGCTGNFPIGFLIWNPAKKLSFAEQTITLDVYNDNAEKYAVKRTTSVDSKNFLNIWAKRARGVNKFPPMSGGINIAYGSRTPKDKVAENFLATFMYSGNDFSNQTYTSIVSGSVARHGGISITEENFEQCMITHMVRRLPKATWLNDRDQFMQPDKPLTREFICDAVVWSLFAPSNQTVSLRNVEYEGVIYRIRNHLYPWLLEDIRAWYCSHPDIRMQIALAQNDRFAARWLHSNRADLSSESLAVLSAGRVIYQYFYEHLNDLDCAKYKIADWDVGWYQVRMSLNGYNFDALKSAVEKLSAKLLPQIYELGFLRDEVIEFD